MTPEAKEALLDEIKEDMRVLVDTLNNMSMSAGMEMAVAGVLTTISRRIERRHDIMDSIKKLNGILTGRGFKRGFKFDTQAKKLLSKPHDPKGSLRRS